MLFAFEMYFIKFLHYLVDLFIEEFVTLILALRNSFDCKMLNSYDHNISPVFEQVRVFDGSFNEFLNPLIAAIFKFIL